MTEQNDDLIEWVAYFDRNMIYCEDTDSFVHRLIIKLFDRNRAQQLAFDVLKEMREEWDKTKENENKEARK